MNPFVIVAHRGYAAKFPENSMSAMHAAVEEGVRYLELDVQLTKDQVPVLFHDATLDRTTNENGSIFEKTFLELADISNGEPKRLGSAFVTERIPRLEDFLVWLGRDKERHVFVEIKNESLSEFGYEVVIDRILPLIAPCSNQITVIGYDLDFLLALRKRGWQGVGWVLTHFNDAEKLLAQEHQPDIIICNFKKLSSAPWEGGWEWMFYEVIDGELARSLVSKGARYIETMELAKLTQALLPGEWR